MNYIMPLNIIAVVVVVVFVVVVSGGFIDLFFLLLMTNECDLIGGLRLLSASSRRSFLSALKLIYVCLSVDPQLSLEQSSLL